MSCFYHVDEKYGSRLPVPSSYLSRILINNKKEEDAMRKDRLLPIFKLLKTKADDAEL